MPSILSNLASGQISIKYGITGPNYAISSACASGSQASLTGHLCGAAGAVEAVFCVLMMKHQFMAPAHNLTSPCPEFEFKIPSVNDAHFAPKIVMNNSFGFGGTNTSMILTASPD